jgi:hypothetical protein
LPMRRGRLNDESAKSGVHVVNSVGGLGSAKNRIGEAWSGTGDSSGVTSLSYGKDPEEGGGGGGVSGAPGMATATRAAALAAAVA